MSYQRGMLPLGEAEAATNIQLDKHFSSIGKLLQSRETYAGEAHSEAHTHFYELTKACL